MIKISGKRYRVKWFNLLLILLLAYQMNYWYQISHNPDQAAEYVEQLKHDDFKGH